MFGWLRRKASPAAASTSPPAAGEEGGALLAFVFLDSTRSPLPAIAQQMAQAICAGRRFTKVQITGQTLTAELGDELVAVGVMPPYPWSELEGPCTTSALWPWPRETSPLTLKDHKAHLLITLLRGRGTPIERRLRLTAATALAARQPGVTGVYWPDAGQVHFPPVFINMADTIDSPQTPPLYLWIDFRVGRNEDGTTALFTTGLKPLGHMEIEIPAIDMPPGELRDWTLNIAYYLLENGPILKDGETIGVSADHKVKIRHVPSRFGHEGKVLCFG